MEKSFPPKNHFDIEMINAVATETKCRAKVIAKMILYYDYSQLHVTYILFVSMKKCALSRFNIP